MNIQKNSIAIIFYLLFLSSTPSSVMAQVDLPAVPNVKGTIGTATLGDQSLSFCTTNDPSEYLINQPKNLVLIGWEVESPPNGINKIVAISNLNNKSCTPVQRLPEGGVTQMNTRVPYAIVDRATDWSKGFTALVITSKNPSFTNEQYLTRLRRHVNLVTKLFSENGMDGYFVYAGEDHEWAFLHWTDEETAKKAFSTVEGATGPKDSKSIQDALPRKQIFQTSPSTTSSVKMIKRASLLAKKPNQTKEEFIKHWLEIHAPIARSIPGIYRYTCTVVTKSTFRNDGPLPMDVEVDGIAEMWFEDQASLDLAIKSPAFKALRTDGAEFIGKEIDFITEENMIVQKK